MGLKKVVNGVMVDMTPEEENALQAEWAVKTEELAKVAYKEKRLAEYPSLGDQLDAVLKQMVKLSKAGIALDPDMQAIVDKWQAVKIKYPKPATPEGG